MKNIKNILLIDDDELFNFIHQEILKNSKISEKIDVATNGKEALKFLSQNEPPDLILLDIDMPIMDGFQFLQEFQALKNGSYQNTKIIILTSSLSHKDIEQAKKFDVDGYINKPLSIDKLQEALES